MRKYLWIALSLTACGGSSPSPTPTYPPISPPSTDARAENTVLRTLSWVRPLEYTDGTPLNDLAGFKIYLSGHEPIDVPDPGQVVYQLELAPAEYQVHMTAYTEAGIESLPSNLVAFSVE